MERGLTLRAVAPAVVVAAIVGARVAPKVAVLRVPVASGLVAGEAVAAAAAMLMGAGGG